MLTQREIIRHHCICTDLLYKVSGRKGDSLQLISATTAIDGSKDLQTGACSIKLTSYKNRMFNFKCSIYFFQRKLHIFLRRCYGAHALFSKKFLGIFRWQHWYSASCSIFAAGLLFISAEWGIFLRLSFSQQLHNFILISQGVPASAPCPRVHDPATPRPARFQ